MAKKPWFKFNPTDWRDDEALRMCSIAARGLWIELLCVMDRAEPRGFLLVKGKRPSVPQIATMCGVTAEECGPLLRELEEHEVFSRRRDGTIFSRKMAKEGAVMRAGEQNAEKRWGAESSEENHNPMGGLTCARDQSPESRDSESRDSEPQRGRARGRARTRTRRPDDFPDQAAVEWARQKCETENIFLDIGREIEKFQAHHDARGELFADWRGCWRTWVLKALDWARRDGKVIPFRQPAATAEECPEWKQRRIMEGWMKEGPSYWHPSFGPTPDEPGCVVSAEIMAALGYARPGRAVR